jgi:protein-L-isoaspartate(D-aspartate) O-methyltransferase
MTDFATAKHNMIEQQIRPWEVLDAQVLDVFNHINRDHFVPEALKGLAYADCQLPIVDGESMLPPTVEGRMLQALKLKPSDSVLEIGTCGGYITACLASLAQHVTSVDFNSHATQLATENLAALCISNIDLQTIESLKDITHEERYDAIALSAGSIDSIPENLKNALVLGGRLFVICGQSPVKHAQLVERVRQSEWTVKNLFETDIPPLSR